MKVKSWVLSLLLGMFFTSCVQDEPLNAECDILACVVQGDLLKMDPRIENDFIFLMLKPAVDLETTELV